MCTVLSSIKQYLFLPQGACLVSDGKLFKFADQPIASSEVLPRVAARQLIQSPLTTPSSFTLKENSQNELILEDEDFKQIALNISQCEVRVLLSTPANKKLKKRSYE